MFVFKNNGPSLLKTNYWVSEHAAHGYVYLSWNAGSARLLVPPATEYSIPEMKTAKRVIVSRGPLKQFGGRQGLEVLFDDESDKPFNILMVAEQCDRLLPPSDVGRKYPFNIYTERGLAASMEGHYRTVKRIPWLKPWAA